MFLEILKHTPVWVWAVLAALIALGLSQTRTRLVSLKRATVVPLLFIVFSLLGVAGSFGHGPVLIAWLAGVLLALIFLRKFVAVRGASWSRSTRQFTVPGSYIPLMLIVGVFLLRYTVGVWLALHHDSANDAGFASACALAYGGFAGMFWARAQSLRRFARSNPPPLEQSLSPG